MGSRRKRLVPAAALLLSISLTAMLTSCAPGTPGAVIHQQAPPGGNAGPDGKPVPFKEPVRLSSKDGVLEVRLSAHQGTVNLDTVKEPVTNFLA